MHNTRSELLIKEQLDELDDINLQKILSSTELADAQIENFDDLQTSCTDKIENLSLSHQEEQGSVFSVEIQPNEFLDNFEVEKEDQKPASKKHHKAKIRMQNKPLFFSLTSILALLCILFIYNLFLLGSLEHKASMMAFGEASNIVATSNENNLVMFDNGSTLPIQNFEQQSPVTPTQTNWFNNLCENLTQTFEK